MEVLWWRTAGPERQTELLPPAHFGEMHHAQQPERGQRDNAQSLAASIRVPWAEHIAKIQTNRCKKTRKLEELQDPSSSRKNQPAQSEAAELGVITPARSGQPATR